MAQIDAERELPDLRGIGRAVVLRIRERPWVAVGAALAAGYLLGGGFFTGPTRWLARAALGALAVPAVREGALGPLRSRRRPGTAAAALPF